MPRRTISSGTITSAGAPIITTSANWTLDYLFINASAVVLPAGGSLTAIVLDGATALFIAEIASTTAAAVPVFSLIELPGIEYPSTGGSLNMSFLYSTGVSGFIRYSVGYTDWTL